MKQQSKLRNPSDSRPRSAKRGRNARLRRVGHILYTVLFATALAPLVAASDPYAINPFRVTQSAAPADPATRWSGFESRVGTYRPTDQYHWWRFDISNRTEAQDAFWNVTAVANTAKSNWSGSWFITPGDITQEWRDAFMRCLNLHRYFYSGDSAVYVQEDNDPTRRAGLQAAALIQGQRPGGLSHLLTAGDFPAGFPNTDLATFYSHYGNLGSTYYPSDISGFVVDGLNPDPGHRFAALNPGLNIFAFGKSGNAEMTTSRPYPTLVYFAHDTTSIYTSGSNYGNPDTRTVPPAPQYDPFDRVCVYPYRGYMALDDYARGPVTFSLDMPAGGLILDPASIRITVTRDGVPLTKITDVGVSFHEGWRQHVSFTVDQGDLNPEWWFKFYGLPYKESTFTVTVSGLKFSTTQAYTPTGRDTDEAPYIAAANPKAFQPHTISWTYTVFDPVAILPQPAPTSRSEITNLSTRAGIGGGDNVLIAGFVVSGNEPLRVAIRAQGPSLAQYGIQRPAVDPRIELYQMGGSAIDLGGNDDWKIGANYRLVQSYGLNPTNDKEAVAVATLMPGNYTAIVSDPSNPGIGIGIVEVFALDGESADRLLNVSSRSIVGSGENALIAGFILQQPTTVLVRTQGPSLTRYGLTGVVNGSKVTIYRQSDHAILASNAGWKNGAGNERLSGDLAGYAPVDAREAAQVITVPAGAYTALVESSDGRDGIGIVEIFNVN